MLLAIFLDLSASIHKVTEQRNSVRCWDQRQTSKEKSLQHFQRAHTLNSYTGCLESALHQSLQVRIFLAEEYGRNLLTSAFCMAMGHIILPEL